MMAAETEASCPVGLADLPHSITAVVLEHLLSLPSGGIKAAAALAFSCRALLDATAAAELLWQQECKRLGWSLAWRAVPPWSSAGPPFAGPSTFSYFCARMGLRWRLRRHLRRLRGFLDPLSAAAIRPPAALDALLEAEAALQMPLPPALFELYRWCDGQSPERGGVQFLDAARLLSLHELRAATQDRHGPLTTRRAFEALAAAGGGSGRGACDAGTGPSSSGGAGSREAVAGPSSSAGACGASARPSSSGSSGGSGAIAGPSSSGGAGSNGGSWAGGVPPAEAPSVLLPFTDELRGRKVYCLALDGSVWLASGFNTLPVAPCLPALLRRVLT